MSLDVYLEGTPSEVPCTCGCGHQHTRSASPELFSANITHNLTSMAEALGIYGIVWRPEENGITKAFQLIDPLTVAIALMRSNPIRFTPFDASNNWGTYNDFLPWLQRYLEACVRHPNATVRVSR